MRTRNIRLTVEYDGTAYFGMAEADPDPDGSGNLRGRLRKICGHPVDLLVAGRTDAGVHALGQTANFHTGSHLPTEKIKKILNYVLPHDIRVVRPGKFPRISIPTYHASGSSTAMSFATAPTTRFSTITITIWSAPL